MEKHKILIIDDEVENLNLLRRTFIRDYTVFMSENASEALNFLDEKKGEISLIISDQRMSPMSGTEFFKVVEKKYPDIMKILLTAYTDVEALVDAINDGKVYKYVTKPWDPEEFKLTVKRALEVFELTKENKILFKDLAQKNVELKQLKEYTDERVEEERLRISRELHDETCQTLASLNVSMEICMRMLRSNLEQDKVDQITQNILNMREQLKEAIQQVRRISMDLRPAELDSLGFISTVNQFVNRYRQLPNTPEVMINVIGDIITLPQKLELSLFRIIQECLNNIRKHAQATNVEVNLDFKETTLDVYVIDNGKGFELPGHLEDLLQEGHLGLVGMNERVKQYNGTFNIQSKAGEGSTIKVSVPCIGGTYQ